MSFPRTLFFLLALTLVISGCAYDPQIAAQYGKDGDSEAVVGPQLPSKNKSSIYQNQSEIYTRKYHPASVIDTSNHSSSTDTAAKPDTSATPATPPSGSKEQPSVTTTSSDAPPANINADLTLPKQDQTEAPAISTTAPETPAKPETPKVDEKIVTDTPTPAVDTAAPTQTAASVPDTTTNSAAATAPAPDPKQEEVAIISTKFGRIVLEFDPEAAPLTVENFKKLVRDGFYDKTTFHRIIPDFMIQGGDPNSKSDDRATHGKGGPSYTIQSEIKLNHKRGSVAAARLPNNVNPLKSSNGSQFYICIIDCPFLDGEYTVFAHVISGMEVVDRISAQSRDDKDNPLQRIEMTVKLGPKPPITSGSSVQNSQP